MDEIGIIIEDLKNWDEISIIKKLEKRKLFFSQEIRTSSILFDLEGVFISMTVKEGIESLIQSAGNSLEAVSFIGIGNGVSKLILQTIDFPIYIAENKEDGVDWLESQKL